MQKKEEEEKRTVLVLHEKSNAQFGTKVVSMVMVLLVLYVQKVLHEEKVC